ncbi:MAG: DNA polymerase III subunit delta [Bacteroidetes bacterium]|nr:MAG: DNA polymerase III subunit delta [Bacteroidota bacterium]
MDEVLSDPFFRTETQFFSPDLAPNKDLIALLLKFQIGFWEVQNTEIHIQKYILRENAAKKRKDSIELFNFGSMDFRSLIGEIKKGVFQPIYLLHGEEPYYLDLISKEIQHRALEEHERDFNQTIVYGKDADLPALVTEANGFPMMSERRLIIIREAQDIRDWDLLERYSEKPNETTIFVLVHKYRKFDSRKKLYKHIQKSGSVFLSEKVKEYKLGEWIESYLKEKNYTITPKATSLLADFLGNDLGKISNELEKLAVLVESGTTISEVHIEENIGISKDYNIFELVNAITVRDVPKAFRIVHYFEHNPKSGSIIMVIPNMFNTFMRIMRIHFLPNKSREAVASVLKIHPYATKDLIQATKIYPPKKIASNVAILHEYDLKSKGINNSTFSQGELLRELIYKLMH